MTNYNCGQILGSLVHRAQGYKRLRDESLIMSKCYISGVNTPENRTWGLVVRNTVALNVYTKERRTLHLGSAVEIENFEDNKGFLPVKVIDNESKHTRSNVYWCPMDVLIIMEQSLWNLIAAVSSPEERIRIPQDINLLNELTSIDKDSIVKVLPLSNCDGIVMNKRLVPELGPGIFFEVELFDDNGVLRHTNSDRCNYFAVNELRLADQLCPKKKSKDSYMRNRNEFDLLGKYYPHTETKRTDDRSISESKFYKTSKFNPGDRIVWISESGDHNGTICWRSPLGGNKLQVHLGKSECRATSCNRSKSNSLSTSELMTEDDYSKRKINFVPQTKSKCGSSYGNEVRVDDLLGLDELDNYSTYKSSNRGINKDYSEEIKPNRNEKYASNSLSKCEAPQWSDESLNADDIGIGSMVEIQLGNKSHYGVIKFIGPVTYGSRTHNSVVAGIEMEEENEMYGDGVLDGVKYFECAPHRGTFDLLHRVKKDSRFQESPYSCVDETKTPEDFGKAVIPGIVEPLNQIGNIHLLCGKYKGIQGHNNSCYLDATLFSMFTFTSVFDDLLFRPPNDSDIEEYEEVQRVLREEIVNPLRKNLFVRSDRVMKLRTLLDSLTSVTGLTCEEKDPEEFLTSLVTQVLKAEPFLKLSSGHEAYYYQLFVEKDERLKLPTVQQLFEQSFIMSDIKLKEVPSCLIIQMPRFGKSYKMYPRILPSQVLDVTDVIENSPRQCSVCAQLAEFECKECFKECYENLECFSFCRTCVKKVHSHEDRIHHRYGRVLIPGQFNNSTSNNSIPRHFMELFAVLCIETSHYVAFVKCGLGPDTPWCFFDSMADRKGGLSGYNIPEMVLCPDLPLWLSEEGTQTFCEVKDDRHLDPYAKRLLCDAYMCMYQSTDVMMYR